MSPNVQIVVNRLLKREGGVKDVGDGAGVTRYGQTKVWLEDFGLTAPGSPEQAAANYAAWMAQTKLDAVVDRDVELGDDVVDLAVNTGTQTAIKILQKALGVLVDGVIGKDTLAMIAFVDPFHLRVEVLARDIEYHGALIEKRPISYAQFAAGWAVRQANKVRSLA